MKLKYLILSPLIWLMSCGALAQSSGNGGVCVDRDGRCMTFYSAKIKVKNETDPFAVHKGVNNVPSLHQLVEFINGSKWMPSRFKKDITDQIIPTKDRLYYDIDSIWFTNENREKILEQFKKATSLPVDQMKLFAVTDTNNNTTYLFPEFYLLQPLEQMAALFHEAYWLYGLEDRDIFSNDLQKNYEHIINAETSFQAMITYPQNLDLTVKFLAVINQLEASVKLAFIEDIKQGAISSSGDFVSGSNRSPVTTKTLYGVSYKNCVMNSGNSNCKSLVIENLTQLKIQFPNSYFLKAAYAFLYLNYLESLYAEDVNDLPVGLYKKMSGDDDEPVIVPGLGVYEELPDGETLTEVVLGHLKSSSRLLGDDYVNEVIMDQR